MFVKLDACRDRRVTESKTLMSSVTGVIARARSLPVHTRHAPLAQLKIEEWFTIIKKMSSRHGHHILGLWRFISLNLQSGL